MLKAGMSLVVSVMMAARMRRAGVVFKNAFLLIDKNDIFHPKKPPEQIRISIFQNILHCQINRGLILFCFVVLYLTVAALMLDSEYCSSIIREEFACFPCLHGFSSYHTQKHSLKTVHRCEGFFLSMYALPIICNSLAQGYRPVS